MDEKGFGIPPDDVYYLFDAHQTATLIISYISKFLRERTSQLKEEDQPAQDLIIYYVGHGNFRETTNEYYLLIRSTQPPDLYLSSIPIQSLAKALHEEARFLRRYIILDSCFSAAAYASFQSAPIEVAYQNVTEFLPEVGTALLCSSNRHVPSLAPPDLEYTMFSGALIEVLRQGDANLPAYFSIQDLYSIIREKIRKKFDDGSRTT